MQIQLIGGGLVGLTAANWLLKNDFDVNLEEAHPPASLDEIARSIRYSALSPTSVKLLQSLGVWEKVCEAPKVLGQYHQMKIWEESLNEPLIFDGKKIAQVPLGFIIHNDTLRKILWEKFQQTSPHHQTHTPALTIAADGARSDTRKKSNINCDLKPYGQKAIIANIQTTKPHANIARQWFSSKGIIAFLPLADPFQVSIVWSLEASLADTIFAMNHASFEEKLQEALGKNILDELGKLTLISDKQMFGLQMQMAKKYIGERLALIGDAAHTVHPLAGFGVNMGICDVASLVKILIKARAEKRDIGSVSVLRKYERERMPENVFMQRTIDSFTQPALRRWGLNATQKLTFLSNFFMHWMSEYGHQNVIV